MVETFHAEATSVEAATDALASVDGPADGRAPPPKDLSVIDNPPWPEHTTHILLAWVLYPVVMRNGIASRLIELVARAGSVARRFATEQRTTIFYTLEMQPCSELSSSRVALLYMNGGGNVVYVATRQSDTLVLSIEESPDGLCEPDPCPVSKKLLARIPVPPGVAFEQRFHVVDVDGDARTEHDEACPPREAD
jgi:hypothetical protein